LQEALTSCNFFCHLAPSLNAPQFASGLESILQPWTRVGLSHKAFVDK
jgi:hypothetical protein